MEERLLEESMLFYFTATGNSLYVAKQLDETPISIAQAIHDHKKVYIGDKIGIMCPVFGHEILSLVREFLENSIFKTQYFYMILTYGNRHGGAVELAQKMLEKLGIHSSYMNVLLMVDNFLPSFDMNKQKMLDKKVDEHIKQIQEDIEKERKYIAPVTDKDRLAHQEYLNRMAKMPRILSLIFIVLQMNVLDVKFVQKYVQRSVLLWRTRRVFGIQRVVLPVWHVSMLAL